MVIVEKIPFLDAVEIHRETASSLKMVIFVFYKLIQHLISNTTFFSDMISNHKSTLWLTVYIECKNVSKPTIQCRYIDSNYKPQANEYLQQSNKLSKLNLRDTGGEPSNNILK